MDVIVIGGGAAGMMAALTAAENQDNRVVLVERGPRLGRKLAVTGNGRCNLANRELSPARYHGRQPAFVRPALGAFGVEATLAFVRGLGLVTVTEPSGRVYPHSDQAGSVVDVLRLALAGRGVTVLTDSPVTEAVRRDGCFSVTAAGRTLKADRLIIACGGAAGTRAGGCMDGYRLLAAFGHSCTPLLPSLVQLKTDNAFTRPLKGVRAVAAVAVEQGGRVLARSRGEVQFTDYGVSGPAVFDIARAAVSAGTGAAVALDLLPQLDEAELLALLAARKQAGLTAENLLTGILHNKLGRTVVTSLGISLAAPVSELAEGQLAAVARHVKRTVLPVTGSLGMEGAQVTAGGVSTAEFDENTMRSRLVPGLYAAGEVLDIDGDCGGYNLQWAWSSGRLAGRLLERGTAAEQ